MSKLTEKIDAEFDEAAKRCFSYLVYRMRDEAGYAPFKVRLTIFVNTEEGTHFSEKEQFVNLEEFEEIYKKYVSEDVLQAAKDIIKSEKPPDL